MKNIIGGESYSLRKLFSGENDKIVIPDLQRDYCWGNPSKNLVAPFIDSLLELDKTQTMTMGLLYGYMDSLNPGHIQLCDGQQRLTTLFLILGVLNRRLRGRYSKLLMSNFELEQDDCEPYLQYAIRESSLYFISDLVTHYFFDNENEGVTIKNIMEEKWFLNSYKTDPTIVCIIEAIQTIENKLQNIEDEKLQLLGDFISGIEENKPCLEFLFCDMEDRKNGEETFVVINTTGESLTACQNLKPLMINQYRKTIDKIEDKWEEMETWFWRNRDKEAKHTSDEGMNEFFRIVRLYYAENTDLYITAAESKDGFPYKDITFNLVYKLFVQYKRVYEIDYSERFDGKINYNLNKQRNGRYTVEQVYCLLPTLKYCMKFEDAKDVNIKRVYHLFRSLTKYDNVSNNFKTNSIPVLNAIKLIDGMVDKDTLCLLNDKRLHDQEKSKLELISHNNIDKETREKTELFLAKAETNQIFNGQLKLIIDWCNNDINRFQKYMEKIESLWVGNCEDNIDILRRALLTCQWQKYPIRVTNKSHYTLGWEWCEWYCFFENNSQKIKEFLESEESLEDRINAFDDQTNLYYPIIKTDILKYSCSKNLYPCGKNIVILMQKERVSSNYIIYFRGIRYDKNFLGTGWNRPWQYEDYIIYCDNDYYNLRIDYVYEEDKGYRIVIFSGIEPEKATFEHFSELENMGYRKVDKGTEGWASEYIPEGEAAKQKAIELAGFVQRTIPA